MDNILPLLPLPICEAITKMPVELKKDITEIRIRVNQPLMLVYGASDLLQSYICRQEDINRVLQVVSKNSVYALEHELKEGFITVRGGHRIGLSGQITISDGKIKSLKNISSLNIRVAREIKGCADFLIPYIIKGRREIFNTLIVAPPRAGKTTVLRDLARQISNGVLKHNFCGMQVSIIDERSEIAACDHGIPTLDVGMRTDVLDGCPKSEGMMMMIRTMSPGVVITDELGRKEDVAAIKEALNAGVSIVATVHGGSVEELLQRPDIKRVFDDNCFKRIIILGIVNCPGKVKQIIDMSSNYVLYPVGQEVKVCC